MHVHKPLIPTLVDQTQCPISELHVALSRESRMGCVGAYEMTEFIRLCLLSLTQKFVHCFSH